MNQDFYNELPKEEQEKFDALKKASIEAQKNYYLTAENAPVLDYGDDGENLSNELPTRIKLEINNLIWMYASEKTTLGLAEEMASRWWLELMENRRQV